MMTLTITVSAARPEHLAKLVQRAISGLSDPAALQPGRPPLVVSGDLGKVVATLEGEAAPEVLALGSRP